MRSYGTIEASHHQLGLIGRWQINQLGLVGRWQINVGVILRFLHFREVESIFNLHLFDTDGTADGMGRACCARTNWDRI